MCEGARRASVLEDRTGVDMAGALVQHEQDCVLIVFCETWGRESKCSVCELSSFFRGAREWEERKRGREKADSPVRVTY